MKELSIEQKAQRFDEAIKRANSLLSGNQLGNAWIYKLLPELKESEDENMRKAVLKAFKIFAEKQAYVGHCLDDIDWDKCIAWIEKQDECHISHDDEIMIEQLIEYFTTGHGLQNTNETVVEWLNDVREKLEKQGEQKSIDKIEPDILIEESYQQQADDLIDMVTEKSADKIEEGKWYVCIRDLLDNYANKAFCKGDIYLSTQKGSLIPSNSNVPFKVVCPDTYFKDWTIQDAKDGDVLASHECLVLFKEIDGLNIRCYCTYHYLNHQAFFVDTLQNKTAFLPATKEQRGTLMKAMADAGYTFDFEKKELKKIEQKPVIVPKFKEGDIIKHKDTNETFEVSKIEIFDADEIYYHLTNGGCICENSDNFERVEQKLADKGEPKFKVGDKIVEDNEFGMVGGEITDIDDTHYELDSGYRYIPISHQDNFKLVEEQNPAWSEEDKVMHRKCICAMRASACGFPEEEKFVEQVNNWLKSFKDRVQPKQEWSEEDEEMLNSIVARLHSHPNVDLEEYSKEYNWLNYTIKSLKPQQQWKPSDEQMKALADALSLAKNCGEEIAFDLMTLYDQLKKLREE